MGKRRKRGGGKERKRGNGERREGGGKEEMRGGGKDATLVNRWIGYCHMIYFGILKIKYKIVTNKIYLEMPLF